jgi:hypothetical protein
MEARCQVSTVLNQETERLHKVSTNSRKERTLHAIRKCKIQALGGHIDVCSCCEQLHISYNSCRNWHCPRCQVYKQAAWVKKWMEKRLPVGYFHVISLQYPKIVYASLYKAAWATLQNFSDNHK